MVVLEHGWSISLVFLVLPLFFFLNLVSAFLNAFLIQNFRLKFWQALFIPFLIWLLTILLTRRWLGSDYSIFLAFSNHLNSLFVPIFFYLIPQIFSMIILKCLKAWENQNVLLGLFAISILSFLLMFFLNFFYSLIYSFLFSIGVD